MNKQVAGLHRTVSSTTLDKILNCKQKYIPHFGKKQQIIKAKINKKIKILTFVCFCKIMQEEVSVMQSNRTNLPAVIIMLLILLLIVVAVALIMRSCGNVKEVEIINQPSGAADNQNPGQVGPNLPGQVSTTPVYDPGVYVPGGNPQNPQNSQNPQNPAQTTPTVVPATPAVVPTPVPAESSGSFMSTNKKLNIRADWQLTPSVGESYSLTLNLYAVSYSLYCREMPSGGTLTIGGRSYSFTTKAVNYDGPGKGENLLATYHMTISKAALGNATVSWYFNGTYSGQHIDSVVAKGKIG